LRRFGADDLRADFAVLRFAILAIGDVSLSVSSVFLPVTNQNYSSAQNARQVLTDY